MTEISLNEESITFFRKFLKDESGYNLLPGKEYFLTSRLKSVMEVHNLPNYDAIITKIRFNKRGPVATDVIEATTVNETFFFRDDKPFEVFRETVMPRLREVAKTRPIKIWSAACSTGQEPYSIAIILEEEKRKNADFEYVIEASDINNRILAKARQGIYSTMEVSRGLLPSQKEKYFTDIGDAWRINDEIKSKVSFFQQNLREDFKSYKGPFDVVFLRNVLIYFDSPLKSEILKKTAKIMQDDATLILGVSENIYDSSIGLIRDGDLTGIYKKKLE